MRAPATFLSDVLSLPIPAPLGPFMTVHVDDDVSLDFVDADGEIDWAKAAVPPPPSTPRQTATARAVAKVGALERRLRRADRRLLYGR